MRSEVLCANIANALTGDSLRGLEKLGFNGNLQAFGLRIAEFEPYDGSVSEESKAAKDLRPVNFKARYRAQIDRAKEKAAARTRAQATPSGQPAAPGAVADVPEAVIDRKQAAIIQAALIQTGFLTGTADGVLGEKSRDAIRKWQAANSHPVTGQLTASQATGLAATNPPDKAADSGMIARTVEGWVSQEEINKVSSKIATLVWSGGRDRIIPEVESCYRSAMPSKNFKSKRYCLILDMAATIFDRMMTQQGLVEYQFFNDDNFVSRFNAAIDDSGLDRRQIDEVSKRLSADVARKLAQEVVRRQPK
nr:peptidoglycan-binding domain-containing protein [Azospirillum melinis]